MNVPPRTSSGRSCRSRARADELGPPRGDLAQAEPVGAVDDRDDRGRPRSRPRSPTLISAFGDRRRPSRTRLTRGCSRERRGDELDQQVGVGHALAAGARAGRVAPRVQPRRVDLALEVEVRHRPASSASSARPSPPGRERARRRRRTAGARPAAARPRVDAHGTATGLAIRRRPRARRAFGERRLPQLGAASRRAFGRGDAAPPPCSSAAAAGPAQRRSTSPGARMSATAAPTGTSSPSAARTPRACRPRAPRSRPYLVGLDLDQRLALGDRVALGLSQRISLPVSWAMPSVGMITSVGHLVVRAFDADVDPRDVPRADVAVQVRLRLAHAGSGPRR